MSFIWSGAQRSCLFVQGFLLCNPRARIKFHEMSSEQRQSAREEKALTDMDQQYQIFYMQANDKEMEAASLRQEAVMLHKRGRSKDALRVLKDAKLLEVRARKLRSINEKFERLVDRYEDTNIANASTNAMKSMMSVLAEKKQMANGNTDVDELMDEIQAEIDESAESSEALARPLDTSAITDSAMSDDMDEELMKELEEMASNSSYAQSEGAGYPPPPNEFNTRQPNAWSTGHDPYPHNAQSAYPMSRGPPPHHPRQPVHPQRPPYRSQFHSVNSVSEGAPQTYIHNMPQAPLHSPLPVPIVRKSDKMPVYGAGASSQRQKGFLVPE